MWQRDEVGVVFNIFEVGESKNVKINHVTLTDDLEIWGQTPFNSSIHNKTCNYDADLSWCLFWHFWSRGSQKNWNKSRDLDGWPSNSRSYIYTIMTFHISGCIYGTDKISVSILTFSRPRISKKTKSITWPWELTLNVKVKLTFIWPLLSSVAYMIQT